LILSLARNLSADFFFPFHHVLIVSLERALAFDEFLFDVVNIFLRVLERELRRLQIALDAMHFIGVPGRRSLHLRQLHRVHADSITRSTYYFRHGLWDPLVEHVGNNPICSRLFNEACYRLRCLYLHIVGYFRHAIIERSAENAGKCE